MKRIQYDVIKPGHKKSKMMVSKTTKAQYYVNLYEDEKRFEIVNTYDQRVTIRDTGNITNLNVLKRTVKEKLVHLGVEFDLEIRVSRPDMVKTRKNKD